MHVCTSLHEFRIQIQINHSSQSVVDVPFASKRDMLFRLEAAAAAAASSEASHEALKGAKIDMMSVLAIAG